MLYKFNIKMTDEDYLEFNKFWMLKSHYGKKQILSLRLIILVILLVFCLISLYGGNFSTEAFIGIIPTIMLLVLFQLCIKPFFAIAFKSTIKNMKKSGKMPYSANSVIEFYEDKFIEITDENEIKQKYSSIERVSIISGKFIYIHINNVMAHTLPWCCFDSDKQREDFVEFIKVKCNNIDIY